MPTEILVIREPDVFSSILIERNFSATNFPVIKTEPLADLSELENRLTDIESFDGIFLTSSKATEIVLAKLSEMRKDFRGKFFVLGKRSADLLKKAGCAVFFAEPATTAEELLRLIPEEELKGKRFFFPRGNRSLRIVPEILANVARVYETIVYKTIDINYDESKIAEIGAKLKAGKFAAVCFFSPSGVRGFLEKLGDFLHGETKIAVIGKTTADCAKTRNLPVDFVSAKPAASDFAFGLIDYLNRNLRN